MNLYRDIRYIRQLSLVEFDFRPNQRAVFPQRQLVRMGKIGVFANRIVNDNRDVHRLFDPCRPAVDFSTPLFRSAVAFEIGVKVVEQFGFAFSDPDSSGTSLVDHSVWKSCKALKAWWLGW